MQAAVSVIIGLAVGFAVVAAARRAPGDRTATWPSWVPLVLGILAAAAVTAGLIGSRMQGAGPEGRLAGLMAPASIALALGAIIAAVGQLARGDRRGQLWAGAAVSALPVAFWLWFFVGELLFPH